MRAIFQFLHIQAQYDKYFLEILSYPALQRQIVWIRYKAYVKTVINRVNTINGRTYGNDPTIFAWDLLNEARCQKCPNNTIAVSNPRIIFCKHAPFFLVCEHCLYVDLQLPCM